MLQFKRKHTPRACARSATLLAVCQTVTCFPEPTESSWWGAENDSLPCWGILPAPSIRTTPIYIRAAMSTRKRSSRSGLLVLLGRVSE